MKLNLKTVRSLFTHGVRIGAGLPQPVASITLHVLNNRGANALSFGSCGSIDRGEFLDTKPRDLKKRILNMRELATRTNPDRDEWMLEVHTTGNMGYSCKLSIN